MAKKAIAPKSVGPSLKMVKFEGAKIADAIAAIGGKKVGGLVHVPVENLVSLPGFNPRITDTKTYVTGVAELAEDIKQEGFYISKPLSVFAALVAGVETAVIIDGHRRYAAAMKAIEDGADIETLPVIFMKAESTDMDLSVATDKMNRSEKLSMMENAVIAKRMTGDGSSNEDIAARLGKTVRYVEDLKVLIGAPKEIRDLIKEGVIGAYPAIQAMRKEGGVEKILENVAKAKAAAEEKAKAKGEVTSGNVRVTKSKLDDDEDVPKVKMATHRLNFQVAEGAEFALEDAEPFMEVLNTFGAGEWFKNARKKANRIALIPVSIEIKVRLPKEEAEEEEVEAAPAKAPAKKAAKAKKAAEAEAEDTLDDGFDDDVVDLKAAGIVDGDDL